jgi:hypothetical protein
MHVKLRGLCAMVLQRFTYMVLTFAGELLANANFLLIIFG